MITKKDLDEAIETAVAQISKAVIKATENMATKDDLKSLATKDDLKRVENRLGGVENRLGGVETDVKIIKREVHYLQKNTPNQIEFKDHEKRIKRLENRVFPQ
ncbi:MAG TPA: hypothetical protein VMW25_05135 [Clostridia bacterium]|nr:hypothetical protein [Clostridia bacterium]